MQDKFQFKLNADVFGKDEAAMLYTAKDLGGYYEVSWDNGEEFGDVSYSYTDVQNMLDKGYWIVE